MKRFVLLLPLALFFISLAQAEDTPSLSYDKRIITLSSSTFPDDIENGDVGLIQVDLQINNLHNKSFFSDEDSNGTVTVDPIILRPPTKNIWIYIWNKNLVNHLFSDCTYELNTSSLNDSILEVEDLSELPSSPRKPKNENGFLFSIRKPGTVVLDFYSKNIHVFVPIVIQENSSTPTVEPNTAIQDTL